MLEKKQASGGCSECIWSRGGQRPLSQKPLFLFACLFEEPGCPAVLELPAALEVLPCTPQPRGSHGGPLRGPLLQRNKYWQHQLEKHGVN